ncbi:hypothetical protein E4K67_22185 [Desulfosporosinus fructosivorans]|uniref:Uncharacterized protein n=1 Tax=Desulfosporosinus fructosivorans TaxID=2018669 RepID=A0A4Z0R0U9_9FIRM|nr:hypothetical protein [Desulfosporosinus fructosivorans]TGE35833.1 hypothetical protein E4K67_22185 [Desulfosporosinus fructosivorans]
MKEMDKALLTQLFQDKPIPGTVLEHFQTQLIAQIVANPVDFGKEKRIVELRKWGIGLVISLMVAGLAFGVFLWFERNIVFQGLNALWFMVSGLTYVSDLQQIGHVILEKLILLRELETGLSLLWGVISWPIFGLVSVFVIFRSANQVQNEKPSI